MEKIFGKTTFPRLRRLRLDSFWVEPDELCTLLLRHRITLEELASSNINLGGTQGEAVEILLRHPHQLLPNRRSSRAIQIGLSREWRLVTMACRELPRLHGVEFEAPSVPAFWITLGFLDVEDLMKLAVNGKENKLVQTQFEGFWDCLEAVWA